MRLLTFFWRKSAQVWEALITWIMSISMHICISVNANDIYDTVAYLKLKIKDLNLKFWFKTVISWLLSLKITIKIPCWRKLKHHKIEKFFSIFHSDGYPIFRQNISSTIVLLSILFRNLVSHAFTVFKIL